ncbi:MAG: LysM peptidoglycan-binding domain-containing protein [bacterium]|nr:LysM peptidoglycan-binding domain-containing protein [bacterium]
MNGRGWCAVLFCLLIVTAEAQQPPPGDLQNAGDHWTAWSPPTSFPEGTQVYTIQAGDTLWSLAERHLGNPHLWPQVWEQNQYILDAHWLYPGDPLVLTGPAVAAAQGVAGPPLAEADAGATEGAVEGAVEDPFAAIQDDMSIAETLTSRSSGLAAPVPLGFESDIYCSGFVGEMEEEFPYRIAGSEYEFMNPTLESGSTSSISGRWGKADTHKYGLGMGDIVYLDGGRADGLSAGLLLTGIHVGYKVVHPVTDKLVGRFYHYMGRVRVLSVQEDTAIGEIVWLCDPMPIGTQLQAFEPEPVPLRRLTPLRPVNFPAAVEELDAGPTIIASRDHVVALGTGHLIFIDRGVAQDVAPGDIYTIYRRGREGFPPIVLGELGVLSVYENSSLARILRNRYTVFVGDALVLK